MTHIFVVQLDIPAEHEAEFNRVYDTEHFPMLSKVPGVLSAARYRLEHSTVPGMQRYLTIYELESPEVMKSAAWEKAGAYGDWATKIRPKLTAAITTSLSASPELRGHMIQINDVPKASASAAFGPAMSQFPSILSQGKSATSN